MKRFIPLIVLACLLITCSSAVAAPKYLFKVASLAPEGSVWVQRFREFAQEVGEKSNGDIGFKIYPGGIMGDDTAMYRKMRVGQLHGGGFTMTGIGPIVPDFRVMGVPFLFRSYAEVDLVRKGLMPHFAKAFAEKGLELIALTEVGFVYTMSTEPISTHADLQAAKSWAPENDPVSSSFLKTLGISPTPLSIPDVMTSLQTGLIDTVFNSFYGSIVMQWFTKAKYITDTPFGYAYGAFLLDAKTFSRLPQQYGALLKSAAEKHFEVLLADTRQSNTDALAALQKNGVCLVTSDSKSMQTYLAKRDESVELVTGKAFSGEIYKETMALLNGRRAQVDK